MCFICINKDGFTALHWAASKGFKSAIEILMKRNANFELKDKVHCIKNIDRYHIIYKICINYTIILCIYIIL